MKKLAFFAILIVFANMSFGQVSLTSFSFFNKPKIGEGVGVFYYLPNSAALGLEFKNNEVWNISSRKTILKTYSIQYYLQDDIYEKVKTRWFVAP